MDVWTTFLNGLVSYTRHSDPLVIDSGAVYYWLEKELGDLFNDRGREKSSFYK